MKRYEISMEITGSTAMWTRPDTGDSPVSYPAPTYSAVKGMFEAILWGPAIQINPQKVEICAPLVYHTYHTNYGGPLRKSSVFKSGGGFQFLSTVLVDVCYRLYAEVEAVGRTAKNLPQSAKSWDQKTTSPGHAHQSIFNRRLHRGQCYYVPNLGWREFVPSYFGPFRETTRVQNEINTVIPSMLREVFPHGYQSNVDARYDQNIKIENGTLVFPQEVTS